MEIDEYRAVVRALEPRLDIPMFDPWQDALCGENVIYASPIVCLPRRDLGVPACVVASEKEINKESERE